MQWNELKTHLRHISSKDLLRVQKAFELGKQVHGNQKRKSGEPYFMHPIAVTHILANMGADADTLIASLLHDTVEDTDLTLKEIDKEFNGDVASLIDGVTKLEPEDVAEEPTLDDQIETLRKMFTLIEEDARVIVIKLVDRLHNMQTIEHLKPEKQKALAQETLDVYVKIADRISMQEMRDELEGLCLAVLEPETYVALLEIREKNEQAANKAIKQMMDTLEKEEELDQEFFMHYEKKPWRKLRMQMNISKATTGVADVVCAIVCDSIPDSYAILGALHQHWARETLSFQDFINTPMINGYRGLHTTIIMESGIRVRCKIRTAEMEEYARDGIATVCFDNERRGVMEYLLPWTERISRLSKDTERDSDAFWESLQSDILGESIVIHGPDDTRIMLPSGSTALDGAFYFLKTHALKLKSISVDGVDVPFYTPLTHGASIDFTSSRTKTVQRTWLDWVNTGTAVAHIRSSLSKESKAMRREVGKNLLQKLFTKSKKGYIEEFDEETLKKTVSQLGYSSLETTYEAIADGYLKATDVYEALFGRGNKTDVGTPKTHPCKICFSIGFDNLDVVASVLQIYKKYGISIKNVRLRPFSMHHTNIHMTQNLSTKEQQNILTDLEAAGAKNVHIEPAGKQKLLLTITVILLWSLNPVIAQWLLMQNMAPITLVTIRQLVFFVFTAIFYVIWRMTSKELQRIPRMTQLALLPALGMFALAIFTYNALLYIPPSIHITILRLNTIVLPLIYLGQRTKTIPQGLTVLVILAVAGLQLKFFTIGNTMVAGTMFSVLALGSYIFFSLKTENVLQQNKIDMRYPSFLFQVGIILGVIALFLIPLQDISALLNPLAGVAALYTLLCVCVPYACYSAVLKKIRFKSITNLFLLEVPLAALFEIIILQRWLPGPAYIMLALVLTGLALLGLRVQTRTNGSETM